MAQPAQSTTKATQQGVPLEASYRIDLRTFILAQLDALLVQFLKAFFSLEVQCMNNGEALREAYEFSTVALVLGVRSQLRELKLLAQSDFSGKATKEVLISTLAFVQMYNQQRDYISRLEKVAGVAADHRDSWLDAERKARDKWQEVRASAFANELSNIDIGNA